MNKTLELNNAFKNGDYKVVLDKAHAILSEEPENWDAIYLVASVKSMPLPDFYDPDTAVALVAAAIEKNSEHETRWLALAEIQTSCGRYGDASDTYKRILLNWPNSYQGMIGLALLYGHPQIKQTHVESRQFLERAIATAPDRGEAYYYLGHQKKMMGEISAAIPLFEHSLTLFIEQGSSMQTVVEEVLRSIRK